MTSSPIRYAARWFLFAALAAAPWFYGGTTSTAIQVTNWLLTASLLFWVIELSVNRRIPRLPWVLMVIAVALLLIGGWMVLNAGAIYDSDYGLFAPIRQIARQLPGSADYSVSVAWMIRAALLLGVVLFVADLSRSDRGLLHLWYAIGVIAGSICLLGLLEKATGAKTLFWGAAIEQYGTIFFASYYYHANAGAFLNVVLPMTAGLALRSFLSPSTPTQRALWLTVFALNLAAVAANTSRGAQVIGALTVVALLAVLGPMIVRRLTRGELNVALAGAAAVLFLLFAVAGASHLEISQKRWETTFSQDISKEGRVQVSQVAIQALPKVGVLGFGPGSFRIVFPLINAQSSHRVLGFWRFLHEDYLQTVIEWGWGGSALWAVLFGGAVVVGTRSGWRQRRARRQSRREKVESRNVGSAAETAAATESSSEAEIRESRIENRESAAAIWSPRRRLIIPLAIIALCGVLLHAVFDFPLQIYSIQVYVATYLGLLWGSARW